MKLANYSRNRQRIFFFAANNLAPLARHLALTTVSLIAGAAMHNEFTAVFERDGDWHIAYSPEIPGANGQGRTKDEARESLAAAIALILAVFPTVCR
jgi:hypothetical protein